MSSKHDAEWQQLCQAIVEETDSQKIAELATQLNNVLDQKFSRPLSTQPEPGFPNRNFV